MRIGVPREIKSHEYRVGLTPASVGELTALGHEVVVERHAAVGIGYHDEDYQRKGARIVADGAAVFAESELIVKVKEIQPSEFGLLRDGQLLFCYLHLASDSRQAQALMDARVSAVAYETVTAPEGGLPLLTPMSEVAGRISIQAGATALQKDSGGRGLLIGGVPGVAPARVVIIGGGTAGANAATIAMGMEADVTILDKAVPRLRWLRDRFGSSLRAVMATAETIHEYVLTADLVVGAVLVPGAVAPKLITRDMVRGMRDGSALVDLSIDQGGSAETSRPTSHEDPLFIDEGVVHYCVTNIPSAVPHTATLALNNATLPFVRALADQGLAALRDDPHLARGLNVHDGGITHPAVAEALGQSVAAFS